MKTLAIIPARYSSLRLPGKPLLKIGDKPMIQWVYEAVKSSELFEEVIVATDESRIASVVDDFDGRFVITDVRHQSGTDRCAQVVRALRRENYDIVVNVQGDQPFITKEMLEKLLQPFKTLYGKPYMSTLVSEFLHSDDLNNPTVVKVLINRQNHAIYFSRLASPYRNVELAYRHVGVYAFSGDSLVKFSSMAPSPLEKAESLEQLRFVEAGFPIYCSKIPYAPLDVNSMDDLWKARDYALTKGLI